MDEMKVGRVPITLVGASVPRSGHHFLAKLLKEYLGDELYYCGWKGAPCCESIPCMQLRKERFVFRKSHDEKFKLDSNADDCLYIIQYRNPRGQALSYERFLSRKDPQLASELMWFLYCDAQYLIRFYNKWLKTTRENYFIVPYERLSSDPASVVESLLLRLGRPVDRPKLEAFVEARRGVSATANPAVWMGGGARAAANSIEERYVDFKPRDEARSEVIEPELLDEFCRYVAERCPKYSSDVHRDLNSRKECTLGKENIFAKIERILSSAHVMTGDELRGAAAQLMDMKGISHAVFRISNEMVQKKMHRDALAVMHDLVARGFRNRALVQKLAELQEMVSG